MLASEQCYHVRVVIDVVFVCFRNCSSNILIRILVVLARGSLVSLRNYVQHLAPFSSFCVSFVLMRFFDDDLKLEFQGVRFPTSKSHQSNVVRSQG